MRVEVYSMKFGCGIQGKSCVVCDDDCWYSAKHDMWYAVTHECPKYRCDRPMEMGFEECEHCGFIDRYILDIYGKAVYNDYQNRKHSAGIENAETVGVLGRKGQDT